MGIVVSKYYQDTEGLKYDVSKCGAAGDVTTKEMVLADLARPLEQQQNILNCFCYS
jgi:hypothetical protein